MRETSRQRCTYVLRRELRAHVAVLAMAVEDSKVGLLVITSKVRLAVVAVLVRFLSSCMRNTPESVQHFSYHS